MPKEAVESQTKTMTRIKKITLPIVITEVVLIAIMTLVYQIVAKSMFFNSVEIRLPQFIDRTISGLTDNVTNEAKMTIQFANSVVTKKYCSNPNNSEYSKDMAAEAALYTDRFADQWSLYYSPVNDIVYMSDTPPVPLSAVPVLKPVLDRVMALSKTTPYTIAVAPDLRTGESKIQIGAPVFDNNGKTVGAIGTALSVGKYMQEHIFARLPKTIECYFFDDDMKIIAARDQSLVEKGASIEEVLSAGLLKKISSVMEKKNRAERDSFKFEKGEYFIQKIPDTTWNMLVYSQYTSKSLYSGVAVVIYFIVAAAILVLGAGLYTAMVKFYKMRDEEKDLGTNLFSQTQNLVVVAKETAATSQEQSAAVKEIVATMEDSNNLSENIATKIEDVSSVAEKTTTDVADGAVALEVNVQKLHEIFDANANTIEGIKKLSKEIDNIWEIVTMITSVADQAKIIAFNAELEAASAGEAGKNFHIVASEIRRLADGIIDNTKQIKERITNIQHSSDTLILASESGTAKINEGCATADELEAKFASIKSAAEITADSAREITSIIQQQSAASGQILITLKQISAGVENFSAATENISSSAEQIKTIANTLNQQVENFDAKQ